MTVVKSDRQELRLEIQELTKISDKVFSTLIKTAVSYATGKGLGLRSVAEKLASLLSRYAKGEEERLQKLCLKYIMTFKNKP